MSSSHSVMGRVALVTGAARGIGRAVAEAFAEAGARVAGFDLLAGPLAQTSRELCGAGLAFTGLEADVTDVASIASAMRQVETGLGPVEILVNCAGTFSYIGPAWEAEPETWFRDVRVNLYGGFLCCHAVLPGMVERGAGCVINITSAGGHDDAHAYSTGYAASKVALTRFTEALAIEAAPHGVRVFAIAPGPVDTEMTQFILNDPGGRRWRPSFKEFFEQGRTQSPAEVAALVVRVAAGEADALTGRFIPADRDLAQLAAAAERIQAEDLLTLRLRRL